MNKISGVMRYIIIPSLNKLLLRRIGIKVVRYSFLPVSKSFFEKFEQFSYLIEDLNNRNIEGDIVECGFGFGRSFSILSYLSKKYNRKLYSFDSFNGFPRVDEHDKSSRNPEVGQWNARSLKEGQEFASTLGIMGKNEYSIQKIIFDESTENPIPNNKIALLHIDLDLYIGYKYSLEMFWDQVTRGGIILFDEFNEEKWPGATKAIYEFLADRRISHDSLLKVNEKTYLIK